MFMNKNIKSYKSFSKISRDFPFLLNRENGKQQIYLDSAASSQKPRQVIDHITNTYINNYAVINFVNKLPYNKMYWRLFGTKNLCQNCYSK